MIELDFDPGAVVLDGRVHLCLIRSSLNLTTRGNLVTAVYRVDLFRGRLHYMWLARREGCGPIPLLKQSSIGEKSM